MSSNTPDKVKPSFEITPIIIKGKSCDSPNRAAHCVDIIGLDFMVIKLDPDAENKWTQSDSVKIDGIESIVIGEPGPRQQYCQTSQIERPLTLKFISEKGHEESIIFTISENIINNSKHCFLNISVVDPEGYFKITQPSKQNRKDWKESEGDFLSPIDVIIVTDKNDRAVCRLMKTAEPIFINLFPLNYKKKKRKRSI